jgi:hypothetical protein
MMFKIIRQGRVFSPEDKGVQDILICSEKICGIEKDLSDLGGQLRVKIIPLLCRFVPDRRVLAN